ncbi:MAG: FecR family protein [Prolixibacteraceae bacterium]|nr:FecR family protein [Prolixibacteraceae bacterium]
MKNNDQQKFELIASILHHEEIEKEQDIADIPADDADLLESKRVFSVKDQVAQLEKMKSAEEAWRQVQPKIFKKNAIDWQRWLSYAAVFVGTVILSTVFNYFYSDDRFSSTPEVFASVNSPRGQITSLTLFDGTTVWLNSGSTLKYSNQFGKGQREVSLEGEALFEVQKDLENSFVVNMDGSMIKVHGTIFNAKNYHAEKEVVLLEGKIEYSNQGKNVFLKPNDRITEDKNTGATTIDKVDASIYSSWIGGKIYFDNESLEDLSLRLERWYDMEFVFEKDNIKSYKFTGVINRDKSLDYCLRIIQLTNKVKFRKERDKIFITE